MGGYPSVRYIGSDLPSDRATRRWVMQPNTQPTETATPKLEAGGSIPGAKETQPRGRRGLSPAMFGVILICFLLPFLTVTCYGSDTVTGVQAATGISLPGSDPKALDHLRDDTPIPNPGAELALISAIAGLGFGFVKGRGGLWASLGAGVIGAGALVAFVVWAASKTSGELILRPGLVAVPLFIAAAWLNAVRLVRLHRANSPPSAPMSQGRSYVTTLIGTIVGAIVVGVPWFVIFAGHDVGVGKVVGAWLGGVIG